MLVKKNFENEDILISQKKPKKIVSKKIKICVYFNMKFYFTRNNN